MFSLRYKLLTIMILLTTLAVSSYLWLATSLINEDKEAYILSEIRNSVASLANELRSANQNITKSMQLSANLFASTQVDSVTKSREVRALFDSEESLVTMAIHRLNAKTGKFEQTLFQGAKDEFLKQIRLTPEENSKRFSEETWSWFSILNKGFVFQKMQAPGSIPLLGVATRGTTTTDGQSVLVVTGEMRQDRRLDILGRSGIYDSYVIDNYGNIVADANMKRLLAPRSLLNNKKIKRIIDAPTPIGVFSTGKGLDGIITGFSKIDLGDLIVISEIGRRKAFMASEILLKRSIKFAILIIMVALIASLLFSRQLTSALQEIYAASLEISKGNLAIEVPVRTRDEVGVLSTAFNFMIKEILRLIEHTAETARMEKELETGQLVQDQFFPKPFVEVGDYEIASFYQPATECGGDWWGYFEMGPKLVILIGDATGHGVPAALITAAVQSCATTIAGFRGDTEQKIFSASQIVSKLNHSVFSASAGKVQMTFFAAVIDLPTGAVEYTNASHEMPLVSTGENEAKADVKTWTGDPGPILGSRDSSQYPMHATALAAGQALLLYTDGLVENRNDKREALGKGRIIRSFRKCAQQPAREICRSLSDSALKFYGKEKWADDVTLVIVKKKITKPKVVPAPPPLPQSA